MAGTFVWVSITGVLGLSNEVDELLAPTSANSFMINMGQDDSRMVRLMP